MSDFPSNALVKYNVGIPCSASVKAICPYGLFIIQRLIIQVRLTGSLLTSNFLERFEKGECETSPFRGCSAHLVCVPAVDGMTRLNKFFYNTLAVKELAIKLQKSLNIQVLKLTHFHRTSGTDYRGWAKSVSRSGEGKREKNRTLSSAV